MRLSLGLLLAQLLVVPTASYAGCPLLHSRSHAPSRPWVRNLLQRSRSTKTFQ